MVRRLEKVLEAAALAILEKEVEKFEFLKNSLKNIENLKDVKDEEN